MEILLQQIINGLVLGSMYALVALGYTMVYGIINLINFAHGEVLMVGALVASLDGGHADGRAGPARLAAAADLADLATIISVHDAELSPSERSPPSHCTTRHKS